MDLSSKKALLLLDLDEVLVTRLTIESRQETVVVIQPEAVEVLRPFAGQVLALTHRSRSEALQILNAFPGMTMILLEVVAAEDLILAAFRTRQFLSLLRGGINKSLYIRMAELKYGVKPNRICILDDSPDNVAAILMSGGGLGLLAPKPLVSSGKVITFDFKSALTFFKALRDHGKVDAKTINLGIGKEIVISDLAKIIVIHSRRINAIRRVARTLRSFFRIYHLK